MKKLILCFALSLIACFSFGQCGPYTITTTPNACNYVLNIPGVASASQIVWNLNGVSDTARRGPVGVTVAGGNGFGTAANQFWPISVCLDATGNIYVVDIFNYRIQKFPAGSTSATNGITVAGGNGQGSAANQLNDPQAIYVDGSGNIYVADGNNNRIQKFPAGSTSATLATTVAGGNGQGNAADQLYNPSGIFIDSTGNMYVADQYNQRIQNFPAGSTSSTNGITVAGGNGWGNAANQFEAPTSVYIDPSGNIYVTDAGNLSRIQKFPAGSTSATNGITVAGGNGPGSAANQLIGPNSIYVDHSGNIYVDDERNYRVQKFPVGSTSTTNAVTIAGGNGQGTTSNQLGVPYGMYIDSLLNIYIADYSNARIQKWSHPATIGIDTSIDIIPPGVYSATVTDTFGCVNQSDTITVNVFSFSSSFSQNICSGSTYSFGGNSLSVSGTYVDTFSSVMGCDSIVTLSLTVNSNSGSSFADSICQGSPYTFGGHSLSMSGTYFNTLTSSTGCDSLITLTLTVHPSSANLSKSICPGSLYSFGGHNLNAPGTYTDTLTSSFGCDSVVTLFLTFFPIRDTISHNLCQGSSYLFGGRTLTTSSTYVDTFYSVMGCDSIIVTLNLTVIPNGSYTLTARDSSCTYIVLTASGASASEKIVWTYNGTDIDSSARGLTGPVSSLTAASGLNPTNIIGYPTGVFVDSSGYIYVSDLVTSSIQKFAPGSVNAAIDTTKAGGNGIGNAANQLNDPYAVFVDGTGNIYVADKTNNRIQKFPPGSTSYSNGVTVAGGFGSTQLNYPTSVYVDSSGNIYVADNGHNRIREFPVGSTSATNGFTVAGGNGAGSAANQFDGPNAVYLDHSGNIYVTDGGNHRIQKFPYGSTSATNGVTVAGGNGQGNAANQLSDPTGLFIDSAGNIYVADGTGQRVQRYPPGSTSATNGTIVAGGNGFGSNINQFVDPMGLYLDKSGNIYVADYTNNRIQIWSQPAISSINTSIIVTSGGIYSVIVTDTFGCIASPDTIIVNPYSDSISQNICQGSTYTFNGLNLSTSGTYYDTLISSTGCDSIITLTLTVNSSPATSVSDTICQNQPYTFGGHSLSMTGTYFDTLTSSHGCDSIITLSLTVNPISASNISSSICPGSGYTLGTHTYITTGTYLDTLTSTLGCDSIITLHLTLLADTVTAYFTLQPSSTPHVWYVVNQCTGTDLSYIWNWGDSTANSTGDTPSHVYATAGYYNICVTATDSAGCSATYCDTNVYLFKDQSGQMVYVRVLPQYPAGINTISTENLNISYYSGAVHFSESLQTPTALKLYDLSGRVVMQQDNFGGNIWDIHSSISQGVYIIQLQNQNYSQSKKLLILQ